MVVMTCCTNATLYTWQLTETILDVFFCLFFFFLGMWYQWLAWSFLHADCFLLLKNCQRFCSRIIVWLGRILESFSVNKHVITLTALTTLHSHRMVIALIIIGDDRTTFLQWIFFLHAIWSIISVKWTLEALALAK